MKRHQHESRATFWFSVAIFLGVLGLHYGQPLLFALDALAVRWAVGHAVDAVRAEPLPAIRRCEAEGCVRPPGHDLPHVGRTGYEIFGQGPGQ